MKLWLLRPMPGAEEWKPWFDKAFGFVIAAETETEARELAGKESGNEFREWREGATNPWLDPVKSTCAELTADNQSAGVILRDFSAA